jgi:diguanylate cyclase (GGDEF)-like protein/PAS domain S-box-containing protein
VDSRRWWLLAGGTLSAFACLGAVADPGLQRPADAAVAAFGLLATVILWTAGSRRTAARRSWRLLAVSPIFPVLGTILVAVLDPPTPLQSVVVRWVPTVPGYLLAIVGLLGLAGGARLRSRGLRSAVEVALFVSGCLITVQLLVLGPAGDWDALRLDEQLVLGAAVLVTSATIAAALTYVGVAEPGRQRVALLLLAGATLLATGRGLATSARLLEHVAVLDASRLLVVAGLAAFALAGLLDARVDEDGTRPASGRSTALGQVLPHIAMLIATVVVAADSALGHQPSVSTLAALVVGVLLAAVHRCQSVHEERRLGARLRRSEAYFRSLVSASGDAVLILDGDLRVTWASPALERILGATAAAQLEGRPLLGSVHPEDVEPLAATLPGATPAEEPGADEPAGTGLQLIRLRDADGTWRFLEAGISDLRHDADVGAVVLHCRDMTERLAREQALQSVAYTDPMTGLPNRAGWLRALEETAAAPAGGAALLLIELDGLLQAREHAGREATTAVVAEIGRRLRATVRGEDLVARLGGGGFAVVAGGSAAEADQLAARCLAVVEQPIVTPAGVLEVTASIGVAPVEPGLAVEDLRTRLELAVQAARSAGPGAAVRYSDRLGDAAVRRDRLRTDLEAASARGELWLAYLPVVDVTEHTVRGVEALLRWRHPELGPIPPGEFLPIAERAGLVGPLQRWVLREATAAAAALSSADRPVRMGVNLSGPYLRSGTVVADVQAALDRSGLSPDRLVLEITDAALLAADERVGLDIASLRLMGVHVALDDFGTGDSALGHLTALPLDVLKLDVSLVARVDKDPHSLALAESIVTIGRTLGLQVGAEGVETPAQLAALIGIGCEFAQGFLIARPMSLGEVTTLLHEGAGRLWPGLVGQR